MGGGAAQPGAGGGLSHCLSPRQRTLSVSAWWASALCPLPPGRDGWGHQSGPLPPQPHAHPHFLLPAPGGGLTEALLEPDSSSALGCAVPFRLRGLGTAALRRLLGGLLDESSYSSAKEKRSLNLTDAEGAAGAGPPASEPRPLPARVSSSLSSTPRSCWSSVCGPSSPPPLRLPPPLPKARHKEPHFILWASSQLACTCCRACRIGVWLKTRGRRRESSQVPGGPQTAPRGVCSCPRPTQLQWAEPQGGRRTVLLGVGQVEAQVVQVLQDLLQGQLRQLAAGAPQAGGGHENGSGWGPGVAGHPHHPF